jgi:TRAP transporter 4TM/12TM fusion protein
MNQTNTPHADPVEDQVVTGVDGEELSELISQYEESAKNTSNDKDEDGGKLRTFQNKIFKGVLRYTAIALALYHIYALIFQLPIPLVLYSIHWGMGLTYAFVYYPSYKGNKKALRKTFGVIDAILAIATIAVVLYILRDPNALMYRVSKANANTLDLVFGTIAMILSLEAARRTIGLGLPIIALVFFAYAMWGNYLPGMIASKGYSFRRVISFIFSVEGIYGSPTASSAQYVFLLIIFGAFLGYSGTGEFFMKLAMKLAGHARGGPAKVAVISSGLFGSISGSAVANVMGTGVFTIPLMKKTGYKPHFAGAVEAVASTGGQIMPPVMGSGAFIMAELIGYKYSQIALGALLPAILYYLSILLMVDFEAAKSGLLGVDTSHMDAAKKILKQGWNLLVPLIILIVCLAFFQFTVARSATLAILATIIACALKKETRMNFKTILDGFETGVLRSVSVICAVASAGVAIGCIMLTGVGAKFAFAVLTLAHNNLFLTLLMSGLAATILGMGLPTVAAYIISASLLASSLVQLGIPIFAAHMFLLYYSILSQITPPVALAAYAAGNIADANPNKVGFTAMRLGVIAFIIPFFFVYGPALLMIGTPLEIIEASITSLIGCFFLAVGLEGWLVEKINIPCRILALGAAFCCIAAGLVTDLIGLGLIVAFLLLHKGTRHKLLRKKSA